MCLFGEDIIILLTPSKTSTKVAKYVSHIRPSIAKGPLPSVDTSESIAIRIRNLGGGRAKLDYACVLGLGGTTSHGASVAFIERRLEEIVHISIYFQRLVPLEAFKVEDGRALAHDFLWKSDFSKQRVERLNEVVVESRALRELCLRHAWMEATVSTALEGSLSRNKAVRTKLVA